MIDTIAECGPGVVGPTGRQIAGVFLNEEVEELKNYLESIKRKWPEYGCTIMCDGWSSQNKHSITNFMVYCDREMIFHKSVDNTNAGSRTTDYLYRLMDKVVEEVGEQYVIQVVTDNEASYKAAGLKLMQKRKHLFWSPCAAHCIDLMREDIGKIDKVKAVITDARKITSFIYNSDALVNLMRTFTEDREILRPGITRFATEYIAIESLLRHQHALKRMFSSHEWQEISYSRNPNRRGLRTEVSTLILTEQFWKRAEIVRATMEPLIKVLKVVDQDKKPTLAVIYDCMDRAKLSIKAFCKFWKNIWQIIDQRWETQLHTDLHAAAYFLNPAMQYNNNFEEDEEVRRGVKAVIKRLEPDILIQAKALNEVKIYREARGEFGEALTKNSRTTCLPAEWWYNYGESAPNLRKIAIKVLSQTCSSSGCERNWSTFALIHTKIRNRLAMKKLEQLVYLHYNLRLRPYINEPNNYGLQVTELESLYKATLAADKSGLQIAIHAIGDKANDLILDLYNSVVSVNGDRDRRFRVEHAQHLALGTPAQFGEQGIIASMQPEHLLVDAASAIEKLGIERAQNGSYLLQSLLANKAQLAFGSDWPVADINPLGGIRAAMKRIPPGWENSWISSECISLEDALNAYTISAATACFLDHDLGSLSPGKLADFVVLSADSWDVFAAGGSASIEATYIGGERAYP